MRKKTLICLCIGLCVYCSLFTHPYDRSFSEIIYTLYPQYHTYEGDWCDQVSEQITRICEAHGGSVSFVELQEGGVDPDYLDLMALEFAKKFEDTFLSLVWPRVDYANEPLIQEVLTKYCTLVYHKKFTLGGAGPKRLFFTIPEKRAHPNRYFDYFPKGMSEYPMMCFLVRAKSVQDVIDAKYEVRKLLGIDPFCIHFNDTHPQCLDLAFMVLNNNSIHFLNTHKRKVFRNFSFLFKTYKSFLADSPFHEQDFCVDGNAVLAAYGIRDMAIDFDFISIKCGGFGEIYPLDYHNDSWETLGLSVNEVIYNPKNFFFFENVKFASLDTIRSFKCKQGSTIDLKDVALIDNMQKSK